MKSFSVITLLAMLQIIACSPFSKKMQVVRSHSLISKDRNLPNNCTFSDSILAPIEIQKKKIGIDWCFTLITTVGRVSSITIDNFLDKNNLNNQNPFGNNKTNDNIFKIGTIECEQTMCTGLKIATKEGNYNYQITAIVQRNDGSSQILTMKGTINIKP